MRGFTRWQESTGWMKKPRDSHACTVTEVKRANAPDGETKAVAEAVNLALRGKTPAERLCELRMTAPHGVGNRLD